MRRESNGPGRRWIGAAALTLALGAAPASADTYDVDAVHSAVMFRAKRMGVVYVYGRFNEFAGTLDIDGESLASGKLALEVKTASVDTGNQRRDDHLRSPDFLNAVQLPVMKFETTGVRAADEGSYEVTGDLTLHGVTKPVIATVEHVGTGKDPRSGKTLLGFEGRFTLKRSDFGMSFMAGPVSDEIDVHIALHAVGR
ncbi:MAG TPA: YceI family protein [Thermoanaerobaculia bacterium]|nr:YceI family protein [Thermoanaerobaculia bacterium]